MSAETIIHNAKIATNGVPSFVEAVAIGNGKIIAAGKTTRFCGCVSPETKVIDGKGRTVIPGLNDSHMHPIRGGLNYNMELALGRRAVACRCTAHVEGAGRAHARAAVGTGGRRLDGISICRAPHAHAR